LHRQTPNQKLDKPKTLYKISEAPISKSIAKNEVYNACAREVTEAIIE
jgi:hypothetical protein